MQPKEIRWEWIASILFCTLVGVAGIAFFGKAIVFLCLPFLIAWSVALLIRPPAAFLSKKARIPVKVTDALLLLLFFFLLGTLLTLGFGRLIEELRRLMTYLEENSDSLGDFLSDIDARFDSLAAGIPLLRKLSEFEGLESLGSAADDMFSSILGGLLEKITSGIPTFLTGLLASLPSVFLFFIITVVASFYFTLDLETVHTFLCGLLPGNVRERLPEYKKSAAAFLGKTVRAYALILFLTFCELYAGFTILSVDYAFLLALIVALVDLLPILGVGTVLVPWALILFLGNNFRLGFGLLILWGTVTILRQIIEPRIVGGTLGIHPLLTLVGMYVGFRLFGILGMLFAPAAILLLRFLKREHEKSGRLREKH